MFRKIENIANLRKKCQTRPEKVDLKLSRYFYRPVSIYLTYIFLKINFSANAITLISILVTLLGSLLIILGGISNIVLGLFCFWLFYLLDFCDGEVARYNNSNSLSGHFFELIAHYVVNILFFCSLAITFYLYTENIFYLIIGMLGLIGDVLIKLKDAVIWQTICIENLRLFKRNDYSKNEKEYQVFFENSNASQEELNKKNKNKFFTFLKKNIFLSHFFANAMYLPFFIVSLLIMIFSMNLIILEVLFIYTCCINIILGIKVTLNTIKQKKTEKTYNKFFNSKDKIDFNL